MWGQLRDEQGVLHRGEWIESARRAACVPPWCAKKFSLFLRKHCCLSRRCSRALASADCRFQFVRERRRVGNALLCIGGPAARFFQCCRSSPLFFLCCFQCGRFTLFDSPAGCRRLRFGILEAPLRRCCSSTNFITVDCPLPSHTPQVPSSDAVIHVPPRTAGWLL